MSTPTKARAASASFSVKADELDFSAFKRYDPVPQEGIERAMRIMRTGEIFRYSISDSETMLLEQDFARYLGVRYALGVNSCSNAILLALIACGVEPGDKVLVPGFTFSAVPSAIVIRGAVPVFVECDKNYCLDVADLRRKITPETKILLLSHMRGHLSDMDAIVEICTKHGIILIEDAAHALGEEWRGKKIGSFGRVGCFSFQSNKIINAGEGGVLTTDDEGIMAKAVYLSGAYEKNCDQHFESPFFAKWKNKLPLHNVRMHNVTAAMARPQIAEIARKGERYRQMYAHLAGGLRAIAGVELPEEPSEVLMVPDSIQFRITGFDAKQMQAFIAHMKKLGLPVAGFADPGNARHFENWGYVDGSLHLPQTKAVLANACDMRLTLALTLAHLDYFVSAVLTAIREIRG